MQNILWQRAADAFSQIKEIVKIAASAAIRQYIPTRPREGRRQPLPRAG